MITLLNLIMDSKKILTIVIVLFIVAILGYTLHQFGGSGSTINSGLSVSSGVNQSDVAQILSQSYIDDLNSLDKIKIKEDDATFFSNPNGTNPSGDPVFRSLVLRSVPLIDEPRGRDNPFLPINPAAVGTTLATGGAIPPVSSRPATAPVAR